MSVVGKGRECAHCHAFVDNLLKCQGCKKVAYCGTECQKLAWPKHKTVCKRSGEEHKQEQQKHKLRQKNSEKLATKESIDLHHNLAVFWSDGVQKASAGDHEGAAWHFLWALFLDQSFDAEITDVQASTVMACAWAARKHFIQPETPVLNPRVKCVPEHSTFQPQRS